MKVADKAVFFMTAAKEVVNYLVLKVSGQSLTA